MTSISVYETPGRSLVSPSKNQQQEFFKTQLSNVSAYVYEFLNADISKRHRAILHDMRKMRTSVCVYIYIYIYIYIYMYMHVSIIQLAVYRAKRNVGQFPFKEKK